MERKMMIWYVLQICSVMIIPCACQNTPPLDAPGFSHSNPIPKNSITATSLDHIPVGAKGTQLPVWIDPLSSGTFDPSQTPFFNWDSLMTSGSMNNMAQGSGFIPTIQLGEGVPVSSVTDVTEITLDGKLDSTGKTSDGWITDVHATADTGLSSTSIDKKPHIMVPSANIPAIDTRGRSLLSQDTLPSTSRLVVGPGQLSPGNSVPIDPALLSPDNPAHADLIDFMITRDMALGIPEINDKAPATVQDPFETNQNSFDPTVTPRDIVPPEGAVLIDKKLPDATNSNRKPRKQTMKKQRQQKKARQQNRKNKNERRKQRQQLRKQAKKQRKAQKQRFFSDKLVARKQRWKKQRLEQKISKHIKKVDNLHQKLQTIEQQTSPNKQDLVSSDKKAFITENNEKQIVQVVTNKKDINTQNTKKNVKVGKGGQNTNLKRKQNKRNRRVNNWRKNKKNNKNKGRRRKWNRN